MIRQRDSDFILENAVLQFASMVLYVLVLMNRRETGTSSVFEDVADSTDRQTHPNFLSSIFMHEERQSDHEALYSTCDEPMTTVRMRVLYCRRDDAVR